MSAIKYNHFMHMQSNHIIVEYKREDYQLCMEWDRKYHFTYALLERYLELNDKYPDENTSSIVRRLKVYLEVFCKLNPHIKSALGKEFLIFCMSMMRVNGEQGDKMCYHCFAKKRPNGKKLKTCSGCKCAWYCSEECQKKDWSRHLLWCAMPDDNKECDVCCKPTNVNKLLNKIIIKNKDVEYSLCGKCAPLFK